MIPEIDTTHFISPQEIQTKFPSRAKLDSNLDS